MRLQNTFWLLPGLVREVFAYTLLSEDSLRAIPGPNNDFDIHDGAILAPILRPRVSGTEGSRAVLSHFAEFFSRNLPEWKLTFQNSSQVTPVSNGEGVPFANLIATRDPPWVKEDGEVGRLALVAHYDSKYTPQGFIGATDSAAPCAMLLHAARSIDAALTRKWSKMEAEGSGSSDLEEHKGVQLLLLDGEEAFVSWTATDSLYGARSLAQEWDEVRYAYSSNYHSPLATIDLFVLLDLLGEENPKVPSYFKTTHWAYKNMASIERRLRAIRRFKSSPNHLSKRAEDVKLAAEPMFLTDGDKADNERWLGGFIEDDHVPFMARGVDILHLITSPFPHVWHKIEDDGEHLHMDTVEDWALLTTAFAAEWLDLEGFLVGDTAGRGVDSPANGSADVRIDDPSVRSVEGQTDKPVDKSVSDAINEGSSAPSHSAPTEGYFGEDEKSEL